MSVKTEAEEWTIPEVVVSGRKKLLVLDVNGFLIDTYRRGRPRPDRQHDGRVKKFYVYNRPFCNDFLRFCLDHFVVGVWSSAQKNNVNAFVEYIFKEAKQKLAFVWHQEHCTDTGLRHPDNCYKPVFLKELWKLWGKIEPGLPWEAGDYGPSNTLLIDDSAHKVIKNPQHTAIIPKTYRATDPGDNFLGKELRIYLQGLLQRTDVQAYLKDNPIGEPSIAMRDPRWSKIFLSLKGENRQGQLVAARVVRTDQSSGQDAAPSGFAELSSQSTYSKSSKKAIGAIGNQDKELEENLRADDGSNLHSMIRQLSLKEA